MAKSVLFRNCVRNKVILLLKEDHVHPKVSSLLQKIICLQNSYEFLNSKCKTVEGDVTVRLLGKPKQNYWQVKNKQTLNTKLLRITNVDKQ